jgi:hypothetical protein
MNKFFTNTLKFTFLYLFIFLLNFNSNAQCTSNIVAIRDTIACGEGVLLQTINLGGGEDDDFSGSTLSGLWSAVSPNYTIGGPCGTNPQGGQHLWFGNGATLPRYARTIQVDASCGGTISFDFRQETQSGNCDGPDLQNEGVYLEYKVPGGNWTTINYFSPIGFPYTGWQNHSFPIPPAAIVPAVQFQWIQLNASGPTWDFWGIDNVSVNSCSNYSINWTGPGVNGYNFDTVTVSPVTPTTYDVMYTNFIDDTCYSALTIHVEQPSIVATVIPSVCSGSDTLFAQATIPSNCYYDLEVWNYLPGTGAQNSGWSVGTVPQTYHNLDLVVNGNFITNYTMVGGGNFTSQNYLVPVTNGDIMDLLFTSLGNGSNEAMYRLYDSQGNQIVVNGFPGSTPINFTNHLAYCPALATYNYSWLNITSGGVAGLNNPNIQNPLATVAQVTNYEVFAYDSLNPGCFVYDTVTVLPNNNNISGTLSGNSNICTGDSVALNFALVGTAPFDLVLDVTDANGSSIQNFQLDQFGFLISNPGNVITFFPSISTTYSVLSLSDNSGCPGSITNPTLSVTVNPFPELVVSSPNTNLCQGQSTTLDLAVTGTANFTIIDGNGFSNIIDANGNLVSTGNPITVTPNVTTTYSFQSIEGANGCLTNYINQNPTNSPVIITINVNPSPNAGNDYTLDVCTDDVNTYDLENLIGPGQDLTGYWTTSSNNQLPANPNFTFDPQSMPGGSYIYTVVSAPCPDAVATVTINLESPPFSGTSNNQSICINDYNPGSLYDLSSLISNGDAGGVWSIGGTIISGQINPSTYGIGTHQFDYTVFGIPPCANSTTSADLSVNPSPDVNTFTTNIPVVAQGFPIDLEVDMLVGVPPFTISLIDDDTPPNNYTIQINVPSMMGTTISTPNVIPFTNYSITNIIDGNGCQGSSLLNVSVGVDPYAVIDPFTTSTPTICEGDPASVAVLLTQGEAPVVIDYSYNGQNYTHTLGVVGSPLPILDNIPLDISNLNIGSNLITIDNLTDNSGTSPPNSTLPSPVSVLVNANPSVVFGTSTAETCLNDPAILTFNFNAGTPPFNIDYKINNNVQTPIILNGSGNQQHSLNPVPNVGVNNYDIVNITDANGCFALPNPTNTIIVVNPIPDIDITVSGANPICVGEASELFFPVISGTPPFNVTYFSGTTSLSADIDAFGNLLSSSAPMTLNPNVTTTYSLVSVIDAKGCINSLSESATVTVNEIPEVIVSGSTEICNQENTPLYFDFTAGSAPWTVAYTINGVPTALTLLNSSDSLIVNPNSITKYIFTNIDDGKCSTIFSDEVIIDVNPLPQAIISGGGSVCDDGSTIEVKIVTTSGTPNYNIYYSAGINNLTAQNVGANYTFSTSEAGTYLLTSVTDSKGCEAQSLNGSAAVVINEFPEVTITAYPQPTTITNPLINFVDESINHVSGFWDFGDGDIELTNFDALSHLYTDTGSYQVMLQIESDSGCISTAYQTIVIDPEYIVYIPEGFSPNNDLLNDYFQPIVSGVSSFKLEIFTRWGQRIFDTNEFSNIYCNDGCPAAWDGKTNNGDYASTGVYLYNIIVFDLNGKERVLSGNIMLFR